MWGVYTLLLGTLLTIGVLSTVAEWGITNATYQVLSAVLFFLTVFAVSFVFYGLSGQFLRKERSHNPDLAAIEVIMTAALFLFLLAFDVKRLLLSLTADGVLLTGDERYMQMAAVTQGNGVIPWMAHGASYLFTLMLRGMCILFGNIPMSLVLLQVLLQLAAFWLVYFAVRTLFGRLAAFTTAAGLAFLPAFADCTTDRTADMLLLCISALALFALSRLLKLIGRAAVQKPAWGVVFFLYGIGMAGCIYLDAAGILLLLISLVGVFSVIRAEQSAKPLIQSRLIQALLICMGAVLGAAAICFVRASLMRTVWTRPILEYWELYIGNLQGAEDIASVMETVRAPYNMLLLALAAFCITGFWFVKRDKLCMAALYFTGTGALQLMAHDGVAYRSVNSFAVLLLAAVALQTAVDYREEKYAAEQEIESETDETAARKAESQAETETAREEDAGTKPRLLDNPLPLPRKHVPRTMDYRITETDSDYDIAVDDNDDFDI